MCKRRIWTPQDLRFISELKHSLAIPHSGPVGMPWKAVYSAIERSDSWYSRVLNPAEPDWFPDSVDLRRIAAVTGNREPLRVMARWMGEELADPSDMSPFQMLANTVQADDAFTSQLSRDLADGALSKGEAKDLLPMAAGRLQQAQSAMDDLRKLAGRK